MNKIIFLFSIFILLLIPRSYASQDTARSTGDWVKDGVIYEVFPREFGPNGTFNEITARIPQLKDLGVTILWLMPIHPTGVVNRKGEYGSPYSVRDYYSITTDYGTENDLRALVQLAHQNNMKVIMDFVGDHTAWDYSWISTHPEYYHKDTAGNIISPNPFWTDVAWLDYSSTTLRNEMKNVMTYWVQTCDIDGYRCDYAAGVPLDFWESVRPQLESIKPSIFMLAEDYTPNELISAFDMMYSWPVRDMLWNVANGATSASYLPVTVSTEENTFPVNSIFLRYIDNHDLWRAPLTFGEQAWKPAAASAFLMNGAPLLYNGQEIGDTTRSDGDFLYQKNPIGWANSTSTRAQGYYNYYKQLISYRQTYPALRSNNIQFVANDQSTTVVSFLRWNSGQTLLAMVNFSNQSVTVNVDISHNLAPQKYRLKNGSTGKPLKKTGSSIINATIPAYDYSLYVVQQTTDSNLFPNSP